MARDERQRYERADFEILYRRNHWHSWEDEIHWLRTKGLEDRDIAPEEAEHMAADIQILKENDIRFTYDYKAAFRLAKAHCNHALRAG